MPEILRALMDTQGAFLRHAIAMAVLASPAFGVMGSLVIARRISYIAGAISHSVLAGIGFSLYAQTHWGWLWCHPRLGALAAALLAAGIIGTVSLHAQEREDTVIGAIWAVGMAAGLLWIAQTPGYINPMSYLFGNILLISSLDLGLVVVLDLIILGIVAYTFNILWAVCFDEEFARVRGIRVERYYLLMLILTALTIVLMINLVGIVMVIALLTLPAAVASYFSNRLGRMMAWATLLCAGFSVMGLIISYSVNWPSGPTIILVAAGAYALMLGLARGWNRMNASASKSPASKT